MAGKKTGKNPTDRGKLGTKRSLLSDANGIPVAVVVAGANVHDAKLLADTLKGLLIRRPSPRRVEQHLLADKGYDDAGSRALAQSEGYIDHIPQRTNAKVKLPKRPGRRKARRWVVERTFSWINRFRRILVRWEKKSANYEAMLAIACTAQVLNKLAGDYVS